MKQESFKSSASSFAFTMSQENLLWSMRMTNINDEKLLNIGGIRGIGTTTALVEFCKQNGYTLIVFNNHMEKILREKHYYGNIFSQSKIRQILDGEKCIIDIGVDLDLARLNCNIIGGVVDSLGCEKYGDDLKNNKKEDKNSSLISVLDNEVQELVKKIQKSREDENLGSYKNLVVALGEIMRLKEKEKDNDWKLKYSEYRDENGKKQVAVWEQNGDGQIRNHKVWNIKEENDNVSAYTINNANIQLNEETLIKIANDVCNRITNKMKYNGVNI